MSQAESEHTPIPSRRDVMRGGGKVAAAAAVLAGAAGAAAVVPASAATAADELILQLGRENDRLYAKLRDPGFPDDLSGKLLDEIWDVEARIAALPATTFAALAVKLRIAASNLPSEGDCDGEQINLQSALADVERMAGRAWA